MVMQNCIDVNTGQVKVTSQRYLLRAMAIGSCIVISAYDKRLKLGGMAHVMLPGKANVTVENKNRYAENAISQLLELISAGGADISNIDLCLVGAGNVLRDEQDTVCSDNIQSVYEILSRNNIEVKAHYLGGYERKAMILDCRSGQVMYSTGNNDFEILWPG